MHKNSTLSKNEDSVSLKKSQYNNALQPKKETLQKILQFASIYKCERITEDKFLEIYLN